MAWSHGTFYWNELMTRDVERAKKFYRRHVGLDIRFDANACAGRIVMLLEPGGAGVDRMTPVN